VRSKKGRKSEHWESLSPWSEAKGAETQVELRPLPFALRAHSRVTAYSSLLTPHFLLLTSYC